MNHPSVNRENRFRSFAPALRGAVLLAVLLASAPRTASNAADSGLYPFPQVEDAELPKTNAPKAVDPFTRALSQKTGVDEKVLTDAFEKGFGRVELTRLILISKKSGAALDALLKEREKGKSLAKIAAANKQDNRAVRKEAEALVKGTQSEAARLAEKAVLFKRTAGTGDAIPEEDAVAASTEPARGKTR